MERQPDDLGLRWGLQQEAGQHRSTSPGLLRMWGAPQAPHPVFLKEVMAIIRPSRWVETKQRVQRLRLPAFTEQRVLGRGRERGLRYLPRHNASAGTGVRYLPKRLISWIVEETQVAPLVNALMEVNRTGQFGDGKIFVLPIEEAVRIRTADRGVAALQTQQPSELIVGSMPAVGQHSEVLNVSGR